MLRSLNLHWKKWRLKNDFFSRVQRKENCISISFCEWLKYVSLMGFGEWDWWSEKCEFNFLKIIRPIAAGLYRQIQFTVQLRKLKSPSHPAVQQMWIKSNIREIFPAMHQAEKRKTKENTHRYTNANTNKIFFQGVPLIHPLYWSSTTWLWFFQVKL